MPDSKHILIVEDEEHLAIGIRYNLEAEGYKVTVASDGPSALRAINESDENEDSISLIILDLMLPGMSGYALCETVRDSGNEMPILILSARTLAEDRARGFDVGANQYMSKPFELDELISRVKNLLSMSPRINKDRSDSNQKLRSFQFGDANINFESFDVTVRDKSVRLTALQMKLLHYFFTNEGRVIPRHELLENVWEMPGHVQTRAPDQFMSQLRKTFEIDPAKPRYFQTIRDAGYRFIANPE